MMSRVFRRMRTLLGMGRVDDEIAREIDFHVRMEIDKRVQAGMTPEEARRTAQRDFGSPGRVREEVRDVKGITWWDTLRQDLRFGFRTLRRTPGYTTAAVLILALGIGANTAMFSVIKGVLLEPLPYTSGDELVLIQQQRPEAGVPTNVSIPELTDYRERLRSVRDLVEYHSMSFALLNEGEPDRVNTGVVSANFFDMLGVRPLLGRTFVDDDDDLGAEAVLVLSHAYWQSKFGGDESVIGRVLEMNNRPHTVVGVLPAHPQYPRDNDVYMSTSACPFRANAQNVVAQNHRAFAGLNVFGRLTPGATVEQAGAEVATLARGFATEFPAHYQRTGPIQGTTVSLRDELVDGARPMLLALGGTTMLVLLIACANVANLALARTVRRSRELAVRTALGAGRARLLRQLVTESVMVAVVGGALGLGLAALSLRLLTSFVGRFTPRTGQIDIDGGVLVFTLAAALLTGVIFGIAPALAVRRNLAQSMRDGGAQAGDGAKRHRVRSGLVVAQVAVSFVLVIGAALLLQSFYRLSSVPLGYRTNQVMTATIFGNFSVGNTDEDALRLQSGILERLRSAPGIRAAALTNAVPQANIAPASLPLEIEGMSTDGEIREVDPNFVSDSYFDVLDVPILAGRDFRMSDGFEAPAVALINQEMASYWNGRNPIGTRFRVANAPTRLDSGDPEWVLVIGVVGNFRLYGVDTEIPAQYYLSINQYPGRGSRMLVRSAGDSYQVVPAMKTAVHQTDARIPVEEIQTLEELRNGRLAVPGLTAALLGIFAAVALVVTLAGIAGVIGTSVSQRIREFGLRMALGASRASVLKLVLGQGLVLVAVGVVIGLGGAWLFSQLIASFLFNTTVTDPVAYALVGAVFLLAGLVAAFGPARRATSVEPLTALRTE